MKIKVFRMFVVCGVVCGLFLMSGGLARATELIWTPINPSFGGSPFNGPWLLDQAQAQNEYPEEAEAWPTYKEDLLEDFQDTLNRQILYRLSSSIVDSAFGEEGLEDGHYVTGTYDILVTTDITGIAVVITDLTTGNLTTVEIPYY